MKEKELLKQTIEFIKRKGLYEEFKETLLEKDSDNLNELQMYEWTNV